MPDFIVYFWSVFGITTEERTCAGMWESWECFITSIGDNRGDIANIMGMAGIALLTIMIQGAVVIFSLENNKDEYKYLDWHVILEQVVKVRHLLLYMGLVYVSLILWVLSPIDWEFQPGYFVAWIFGVIGMGTILRAIYKWVKGGRFEPRMKHLQKSRDSENSEEVVKVWRSVWEAKNADEFKEKCFFGVFTSTIDNFLGNNSDKNIIILTRMFNDFNEFIDNRSTRFLIFFEKIFPQILAWNSRIWEKREKTDRVNQINTWMMYCGLFDSLFDIAKKITKRGLEKRCFPRVFAVLRTHIEECIFSKKESGMSYVKYLTGGFFSVFMKTIIEVEDRKFFENREVWVYFQSNGWTITKDNLEKNRVARFFSDYFFQWVREYTRLKKECDAVMFYAFINLFPNACTMTMARIFTVEMLREEKNLMKYLVEHSLNYYELDRAGFDFIHYGKLKDKELKIKEDEAIALALRWDWLGYVFTKNTLERYVKELQSMKEDYSGKDKEEENRRLLEYIDLFEDIQKEFDRRAKNAAE